MQAAMLEKADRLRHTFGVLSQKELRAFRRLIRRVCINHTASWEKFGEAQDQWLGMSDEFRECRARRAHDFPLSTQLQLKMPHRGFEGWSKTSTCTRCGTLRHTRETDWGAYRSHKYEYPEGYILIGCIEQITARDIENLNIPERINDELDRLLKRAEKGKPLY